MSKAIHPHSTSPKVSGIVIDKLSKKPVAGAKVGMRDRSNIFTTTAEDGSFDLPSVREWGLAYFIPMEHMANGEMYVESPEYMTYRRRIESWRGMPVKLKEPIELSRQMIAQPRYGKPR